MQGVRDCGKSLEVKFCSIPVGPLSGDSSGLPVFGGFSVPGSDRQAAISRRRISVLRSTDCWQSLLGTLSSLTHLVPGGRLRMRSLQFQLHRNWDRVEDSTLIPWTSACRLDLLWWLDELRLRRGVSLTQVSSDLDFWSDTSDVGWGAHLGQEVVPSLWFPSEVGVSINARELLVVERGLLHFQASLRGSTAVTYLSFSTKLLRGS